MKRNPGLANPHQDITEDTIRGSQASSCETRKSWLRGGHIEAGETASDKPKEELGLLAREEVEGAPYLVRHTDGARCRW